MMQPTLAAAYEFDAVTFTIKSLAVVGGAVLGGLALAALAGLFVRLLTTRKLPPKVRWLLRLMGALLIGWIVALFLFGGGGGWGLGGTGGWGFGGSPTVPL